MKRKKKPIRSPSRRNLSSKATPNAVVAPFAEHVQELRRRLYYIAASVLLWGCAAYGVQQYIVAALLRPAKGQHFIYTTPGGGIDFLFRICVYSGLILSLPVIVYNSLRFIEPLVSKGSARFILWGSAISGLLAAAGMFFGYYLGLPAALHFLLHQFTTAQIQPLVTIQSYFGFVVVYMVGSALLFQLPLLLIFINRIKPLDPRQLLHYERWVILIAFILAVLMNPTPNVISQLLIAVPFILMYQVGIGLIAVINRHNRAPAVDQLAEQDTVTQTERQQQSVKQSVPAPLSVKVPALGSSHRPQKVLDGVSRTIPQRQVVRQTALPRQRFMDFVPRSAPSGASES